MLVDVPSWLPLGALSLAAIPVVVVGGLVLIRYDWRKPSDFGLRQAGPPPMPLLLGFALVLVAAIVLWWLMAAGPAG
jgi:hypothetical protein